MEVKIFGATFIELIRQNDAVYDSRLPHQLLYRKGYDGDITACLGFESMQREASEIMASMKAGGCHPARAFQAFSIVLSLHRAKKLRAGKSYLCIGEEFPVESAPYFLRFHLEDGKVRIDLFSTGEVVDYYDIVCLATQTLKG